MASLPEQRPDLDYRELLAVLSEVIVLVDSDLRVIDVNQRDSSLLVGNPGRDVALHDVFEPAVADVLAGLISVARVDRSAEGELDASGSLFRVNAHQMTSSPLTVVVIQDISVRRNAELALMDLVRDKTNFLAGMSNELRAPLEAVIRYANLLSEPHPEVDEAARLSMVEGMADQAWDLAGIVEDLLTMAHIDMGDLRVADVPFNVTSSASQVIESMGGRGTSITLTGDSAVVGVGDPGRFRQIVRNLISNALTHGSGPVTVDIASSDHRAVLTVSDRGPGVPAEAQDVMFSRSASGKTMGETSGVGLGLWISSELASLMGGGVAYRREHGFTKFEVAVPLGT